MTTNNSPIYNVNGTNVRGSATDQAAASETIVITKSFDRRQRRWHQTAVSRQVEAEHQEQLNQHSAQIARMNDQAERHEQWLQR